ncbi:hypothetical protein [Neolewinella persica]|uniref:hypothetical protein n=1 Tax=Neolewinella persica TaxID=70998 RepID=UPI00037922EB|nr:hypothetical protein [Neolewinella persica]
MYIEQNHLLIAALAIVILSLSFGIWLLFKAMFAMSRNNNGSSDVIVDRGAGGIFQFIIGVAIVIAILYFFSDPNFRISTLFDPIQANPTGQKDTSPNKQASPNTYDRSQETGDHRKGKPSPVNDSDLSRLDGKTGMQQVPQAPPPPPTNHTYKDVREKTKNQRKFFIVPVGCYKKPGKAFNSLSGPTELRLKIYVKGIDCSKVGYGPFNNEREAIAFRRKHNLEHKPEQYIWPAP